MFKNLTKKIAAVGITGLVIGSGVSSVFANNSGTSINVISGDKVLDISGAYEIDFKDLYKELDLNSEQIKDVEKLILKEDKLFEQIEKIYEKNSKAFEDLDKKYLYLFENLDGKFAESLESEVYDVKFDDDKIVEFNNLDFEKFDKEYQKLLDKFGISKLEKEIEDIEKKIQDITGVVLEDKLINTGLVEDFFIDGDYGYDLDNPELKKLNSKIDKIILDNLDKFEDLDKKFFSNERIEISEKNLDLYEKELIVLEKSLGIDKLNKKVDEIYSRDLENSVNFSEEQEKEFLEVDKKINSIIEKNSKDFEKLDLKYENLEKKFNGEFEKISDEDFDFEFKKLEEKYKKDFEDLDLEYENLEKKLGLGDLYEKFMVTLD